MIPRSAPPTLAPHRAESARELVADLSASDPKIRRAAVREVGRDRDADPPVLLAASRDPDLEVGVLATEGLGRLHAAGALQHRTTTARCYECEQDMVAPHRRRRGRVHWCEGCEGCSSIAAITVFDAFVDA